ncbi:MAG: hypothetical protein ACI9YH_004175 [Colwellia sp.]|jgi:hypothetical protein
MTIYLSILIIGNKKIMYLEKAMLKQVMVFMISITFSTVLVAESLYVFVPTEVRANKLQQKIGSYCSGVDVTVFGRAKDFHNKVKAVPPTAILSLLPVVEHTLSFNTAIMGLRDGLNSEGYVLVSIDRPMSLDSLNNKKIGVVDLLGRKPMRAFIEQLLKTEIMLKRVTKVEDLLPLITFESVDAIFISESMFEQLKLKSKLKLVATPLNINIGLASAALSDVIIKDQLKNCLYAFDKKLNSTLGVDQWHTL